MTSTRRRHSGFSLLELILAVAITAMACTASATVLKAVADTWQTTDDIHDAVSSTRHALTRLRTVIKQGRLFGYRSGSTLVFWANDDNNDLQINYAELQMVRYQPSERKLELLDVYFPPGTPDGEIDTRSTVLSPVEIAESSIVQILETDAYVRVRPLAYEIQQFSMALDTAGPDSRWVRFSLEVQRKNISQHLHTLVGLRAPAYYLLE